MIVRFIKEKLSFENKHMTAHKLLFMIISVRIVCFIETCEWAIIHYKSCYHFHKITFLILDLFIELKEQETFFVNIILFFVWLIS